MSDKITELASHDPYSETAVNEAEELERARERIKDQIVWYGIMDDTIRENNELRMMLKHGFGLANGDVGLG